MSFSSVPVHRGNKKRKRVDASLPCIYCDEVEGTVLKPKYESYITIQKAGSRRKDNIKKKFDLLFIDSKKADQTFSWHRECFATYTSEEKIRRRELVLTKDLSVNNEVNNLEKQPESSSSQPIKLRQSLRSKHDCCDDKCFICGCYEKEKKTTSFIM